MSKISAEDVKQAADLLTGWNSHIDMFRFDLDIFHLKQGWETVFKIS